MTNQIGGKSNQELGAELAPQPESTAVTSIDPAQLNEVSVYESPIWEEIADPSEDDRDLEPDLAEVLGVESVGGTVTTPDWNDAEDLAVSVGIGIPVGEASLKENREILHTNEILEHRDTDSAEPRLRQRWELDPQSAEDFEK